MVILMRLHIIRSKFWVIPFLFYIFQFFSHVGCSISYGEFAIFILHWILKEDMTKTIILRRFSTFPMLKKRLSTPLILMFWVRWRNLAFIIVSWVCRLIQVLFTTPNRRYFITVIGLYLKRMLFRWWRPWFWFLFLKAIWSLKWNWFERWCSIDLLRWSRGGTSGNHICLSNVTIKLD